MHKYQQFLKGLLENYSFPENLLEDIKEILYEQELTHFENNNEFIAQLPLSPISKSSNFASSLNSSKLYSAKKLDYEERKVAHNHDRLKEGIPALDL